MSHWLIAGLLFIGVQAAVFARFAFLLFRGRTHSETRRMDRMCIFAFVASILIAFPVVVSILILQGTNVVLPIIPDVFGTDRANAWPR